MSTRAKLITIAAAVVIASLGGIAAQARMMPPEGSEPWPGDPPSGNDCIMTDLASITNPSCFSSPDIIAARDFRDYVLAKSNTGTKITSLYYTYSNEVFNKALTDSNYRNQLIANIKSIMPLVYRAEVQIQDAKSQGIQPQIDLVLTQADMNAVDSTLSQLNANGSLALQQEVATLRSSAGNLQQYVGVQAQLAMQQVTLTN